MVRWENSGGKRFEILVEQSIAARLNGLPLRTVPSTGKLVELRHNVGE